MSIWLQACGFIVYILILIIILARLNILILEPLCCLSAEGVQPISWSTRMKIATDVARGLSFLHGLDANVIYRDLKASNVLLDSVR